MASTLSPSALRQIIYLDSLELALDLKGKVDDEDVRAIFAHGRPLNFSRCPRLLVSKIVEVFTKLQKEPAYLDVTVTAASGFVLTRPSEAWCQVYITHLPCHMCTTIETVEKRGIPGLRLRHLRSEEEPVGTEDVVVERFHVSSESFGKQLIVELHYELTQGTAETEREQSSFVHKITIRLTNETCSTPGTLIGIVNRSSATPLLLPEFTSDVFGFLNRAHVGSSLIANRALRDRLGQLKQRLPVHHLTCSFGKELLGRGCIRRPSGAYWLTIRRFRRDMAYTDVRCFKMPSTVGAENDCALIRHYLSNSHVDDLLAPDDYSFVMKMLADLVHRNFSVDRVKLSAGDARLSDYRSMDVVFGVMRMTHLHLNCAEHRFFELVKTTDFFRMSTIQGLRELRNLPAA
ncbi:hypothetical protein AAVH_25285 [Aphelenchoides avenae]|nr:hypothetical protein AAVH_25285 [Aphelenchus avenae]